MNNITEISNFTVISNITNNSNKEGYYYNYNSNDYFTIFCVICLICLFYNNFLSNFFDRSFKFIKQKFNERKRERKLIKCLKKYDNSETKYNCQICLQNDNNEIYELKCKHIFHKTCITEWYLSDNCNNCNCPICRNLMTV